MGDLTSLLPLIYNGALLLALAVIYDALDIPARGHPGLPQQLLLGISAGVIGLIVMVTPWQYAPGIVFDMRSVLLSISGLFFGALPTLIAMAITAALRIYQGGSGAVMGVAVIITSGLIGIGWRHWRRPALARLSWGELFLFGLVVHLAMLAMTVFLPTAVRMAVLTAIALSVLLLYPLATALFGRLLVNRQRRDLAVYALQESEERYRSYLDNAPYGVFVVDETGRFLEANAAACKITGYSEAEILTMGIADTLPAAAQAAGVQHFQQVATEGRAYGELPFRRKDGSTGWWSVAAVRLSSTRALGFIVDITAARAAEEATRQAEAAYRDLYEHAPDMFLSVDATTARIVQCNETTAEAVGYSKDELIGRPILDLYHPDSYAAFYAAFAAFESTGEVHNAEMKIRRKDGSELWVILNATAVRDANGKILQSRAIWRDITAGKAAAEQALAAQTALRQNEERFRHVASSISDIAYSCVDDDGAGMVLEWMTGAAERITGYSVDEIVVMRCWGHLVLDADMPLFSEKILALAPGDSSVCELRLRRRDGPIIWVEATAECVADTRGSRLYGALVDITARKEAETALRQSEERARALINATDDAAFLIDRQGRVLALNQETAKRLDRSKLEILGASIYELLPPNVAQHRREQVETVLRTALPVRFEDARAGAVIDNSLYPVIDAAGEVSGVAIFGRDITGQRLAEEQYQTLFREMLDGFALHEIICDDQGQPVDYRFLVVNPAFERMTGLPAAAAIGHTVLELMPATEAYWIETYGRVALTGEPAVIENFSRVIDRYFLVTAFSPKHGQFATIFADVTERKRAELALQRRDALLVALSYAADRFLQAENWEDEMPGVLARLGEAAQVSRVYVFQNETDAAGAVLTSQRFEWCAPGVAPQIDNPFLQHAAYANLGFARWEELLSRSEMIRGNVHDFPEHEREILTAQDVQSLVIVPIHVEKNWWGFAGFGICDREYEWLDIGIESLRAAGHVFSAAVKNQQHREQLRAQASQMAQIMNSVADGMLLIDAAGRVHMANRHARQHLTALTGDAAGRPITQLGDQPLATLFNSPPLPGQGHRVQAQQRTFDLLAHPVESGVTPGASPDAWVLVVRDVTDELAFQQQQQRQERLAAIGQLAAGIAHDFNNLMSVIILYAQLTAQANVMGARERERLAVIEQQGKRGTEMIRQILDFSRRTVLDRQPIDLLPLLKEQVKLLTRTLPEHIVIRLDCQPGEYVVRADPTRFEQVIMNLAVNARDAMPEGGNLTIALDHVGYASAKDAPLLGMKAGMWVRLTVADSGAGIAADVLDHIFEPFFTTKAVGLGTGLGLAQVHGIVAQHDGHIAVESQVGAGTTFTIYLPDPGIVRPGVAPSAEMEELADGHGETILLAEDDPYLRATLAELLELWNYQVLPVANGLEALIALDDAAGGIDLIISDVVMPEMTGIALFKALRQRQADTPLILLTGHPMNDELDNLRRFGLRAWLPKPPIAEQLAATIAAILAEHRGASGEN